MKTLLNSLFKRNLETENNPPDSWFDDFSYQLYITNEYKFQHQNKKYQFRATPNKKITIGFLLNRIFDVSQEEISDLYIITDNWNEKQGNLITDKNDIWNFDLCFAIIDYNDGDICYKFNENVILAISYRKEENQLGNDRSKYRKDNNIIIHLKGTGAGKDSWFVRASIMIPLFSNEVTDGYKRTLNKPDTISILFAYDHTSPEKRILEFEDAYQSILEKIDKGEVLDRNEYLIIKNTTTSIRESFYWGYKVLKENRYLDAIMYFENVYYDLCTAWLESSITNIEKEVFWDACYWIGFCYTELFLYEKALFYLDIVYRTNRIPYKMEYINCLVDSKHFRALLFINNELIILSQSKEKNNQEYLSYMNFLCRRKVYVLIDKGQLEEAEEELMEMLKNEENKDFAQDELAYIQKLKNIS